MIVTVLDAVYVEPKKKVHVEGKRSVIDAR